MTPGEAAASAAVIVGLAIFASRIQSRQAIARRVRRQSERKAKLERYARVAFAHVVATEVIITDDEREFVIAEDVASTSGSTECEAICRLAFPSGRTIAGRFILGSPIGGMVVIDDLNQVIDRRHHSLGHFNFDEGELEDLLDLIEDGMPVSTT